MFDHNLKIYDLKFYLHICFIFSSTIYKYVVALFNAFINSSMFRFYYKCPETTFYKIL